MKINKLNRKTNNWVSSEYWDKIEENFEIFIFELMKMLKFYKFSFLSNLTFNFFVLSNTSENFGCGFSERNYFFERKCCFILKFLPIFEILLYFWNSDLFLKFCFIIEHSSFYWVFCFILLFVLETYYYRHITYT